MRVFWSCDWVDWWVFGMDIFCLFWNLLNWELISSVLKIIDLLLMEWLFLRSKMYGCNFNLYFKVFFYYRFFY